MAEPTEDEIVREIAEDLKNGGLVDEDCVDCARPGYKEDEYPDYNINETRVISGPLGNATFPGTRYNSWREAEKSVASKTSLVRFWVHGPRWFARIRK